ncbi:MAG TPA: 4Fe-4S binding protein [Parvibaculum sp.]|jgi:hypothetical protein
MVVIDTSKRRAGAAVGVAGPEIWFRAHTPRPGLFPGLAAAMEAFFTRHRRKLPYVHAVFFVGFLVAIILPLFLPLPPEDATPLNNFTLAVNFSFWGLWFPLVFLSVLFTGRSWCGVLCPMGAASEWANRVGLKRKIPGWLRWEGAPIVSFLVITVLGQTVGVRDHPLGIAEVFGGTLLAALAIGFLYGRNKRAWCRHACPIGLLLGVFSRLGAVQFAVKSKHPGGDLYTERGVCPTMIAIPRKEESRHCIECFRCVKPSSPGGLFLRLRAPGDEVARIRDHNPNMAELWFMFLGTGAALGGFLWLALSSYQTIRMAVGAWAIEHGMFWVGSPGPWWLMSVHPEAREVFTWLDFGMIVGFMMGWALLLAAGLFVATGVSAWLAGRFGSADAFATRFVELGYQFAPAAMVSLLIGLGGKLFDTAVAAGIPASEVGALKAALLGGAVIWGLVLATRILSRQGVSPRGRIAALVPGLIGSLFIAFCWWPAVIGS